MEGAALKLKRIQYVSRTKPMRHQSEALRRRTVRPRLPTSADVFADLAEQGTGKSKVIVDEFQFGVSDNVYDDLLVISKAGSIRNWYEAKTDDQLGELETHLDPRLFKILAVGAWSRRAAKRRNLERVLSTTDRPRALFVHIEALSAVDDAADAILRFLSPGRRVLGVIDESTLIRSSKAQRTKVLMRVRDRLAGRRILTGLVSPKSPLDLYHQFAWLDWRILGQESYVNFRARYAIVKRVCFLPNEVIRAKLRKLTKVDDRGAADGLLRRKLQIMVGSNLPVPPGVPRAKVEARIRGELDTMKQQEMIEAVTRLGGYVQSRPKIEGYRNLEEIQKLIAPYSYRVLKKDALDLKPKVYQSRDVPLTKEQKKAYVEIKEYATTMLDSGDHVVVSAVVQQIVRLHQVACGHVADENKVVHDVPSNRIPAILEILEEHSGKAIVWSHYRREISKIVAALDEEYGSGSCAQFHGGNVRSRGDDERRFLGDPACRFMVSTQSAGGWGNTWNVADLTIYASNSYDLELRAQSEDRNHRKGQRASVTYVDLVSRGTVDEVIIRALRRKIDLFTAVTGENYRQWLI